MSGYIRSCFKQYVGFRGRARRTEYWSFVFFNVAIQISIGILSGLALAFKSPNGAMIIGSLGYVYMLGVALPGLAVSVRRMHDLGKGGGWILINLIPIIGWIWFLVLACTAGETGENRFGKDPIAEEAGE